MDFIIRAAKDTDAELVADFAVALSRFNRQHHQDICKVDEYETVLAAIRAKAEKTVPNRDENTLILIAESSRGPVGYILARIYEEEETADNGTGRTGLLDELYIDEKARGLSLGTRLIDEAIAWLKSKEVRRVKLHAYTWNEHAKRIYEGKGFSAYGVSYELFV